jgi:hypothetical protein
MSTSSSQRTYYKLEIGGIVYLVDPATSLAYTYDITAPTQIGTVTWTNPKAVPQLQLRDDWQTVLDTKLAGLTPGPTASNAPDHL